MATPEIKWQSIAATWDGRPARPDEVVRVGLRLLPAGDLVARVDAPWHGDPPPPGPPGRTDRLWEHEVVELFVAGSGGRYIELEVAPGRHLLLAFDGYRRRTADDLPGARCEGRLAGGNPARWTADLHVPAAVLPPGPLRHNAYAAHGVGAARRLLALFPPAAPGPCPDFHDLTPFRPL